MKIVHYILGLPPHRSGGMTRYAIDLMKAQMELQHEVTAIYPGNFSFFSYVSTLRKRGEFEGINIWKLTNALPVPILYGIRHPHLFFKKRKINQFNDFIREVQPDVLHIHTLMGMPKELISMFQQAGIKVVYTSHDYFGLCPKVNFINLLGEVCSDSGPEKCAVCCQYAKPSWFLKLRNSEYFVPLKKWLK